MTAATLVATLRARGVTLSPDGDKLRVRPAERLTPAELDTLRAHKVEVLRLLSALPTDAPRPRHVIFRMNLQHAQPCQVQGCRDCWP